MPSPDLARSYPISPDLTPSRLASPELARPRPSSPRLAPLHCLRLLAAPRADPQVGAEAARDRVLMENTLMAAQARVAPPQLITTPSP